MGRKHMSRIPNAAMPHAWAEDSEHAEQVRRERASGSRTVPFWLQFAALAGVGYLGLKLMFGHRDHA